MKFRTTLATTVLLTLSAVNSALAATATTAAAAPATTAGAAPGPSTTITLNGTTFVYPPLDKVPDVNDPQVKTWLSQIDLTKIPKLPVSNGGQISQLSANCNPPTVIQPDQGSWTCQKYEAPDDITACPQHETWGLTYDDGPSLGTPNLLAKLSSLGYHATFFVVGSRVVSYPDIVKQEYNAGHEIAIHTWSHPALTSLSNEQVIAELKWTMKAVKDVLGVTPRYMRPPYGDTDNRVRALAAAVGLKTIIWTQGYDTNDWDLSTQPTPNVSMVTSTFTSWFPAIKARSNGFIVLEHDLFNQTVQAAIATLDVAAANKDFLIVKSVSECVGDLKPYQEFPLVTNSSSTGTSTKSNPDPKASSASLVTGNSLSVLMTAAFALAAKALLTGL